MTTLELSLVLFVMYANEFNVFCVPLIKYLPAFALTATRC